MQPADRAWDRAHRRFGADLRAARAHRQVAAELAARARGHEADFEDPRLIPRLPVVARQRARRLRATAPEDLRLVPRDRLPYSSAEHVICQRMVARAKRRPHRGFTCQKFPPSYDGAGQGGQNFARYFFHIERRRRLLRAAAIGTTLTFGDFSATAARARSRPCNASSLCNASTALSMKRSTSTPSKSASSSAAASTSGVTQRAHRREGSCPIPAFVAEAAPLSRQCECIHGAGTSASPRETGSRNRSSMISEYVTSTCSVGSSHVMPRESWKSRVGDVWARP
jgi:hypothetical protein